MSGRDPTRPSQDLEEVDIRLRRLTRKQRRRLVGGGHDWSMDFAEYREQQPRYLLDPSDIAALMPAARCRECGAVTWHVNLVRGLSRAKDTHASGCSRPPGIFDDEGER